MVNKFSLAFLLFNILFTKATMCMDDFLNGITAQEIEETLARGVWPTTGSIFQNTGPITQNAFMHSHELFLANKIIKEEDQGLLIMLKKFYDNLRDDEFGCNVANILEKLTDSMFEDGIIYNIDKIREAKIPGKHILNNDTLIAYPGYNCTLIEKREPGIINITLNLENTERHSIAKQSYFYKNRLYSIFDLLGLIIKYSSYYLSLKKNQQPELVSQPTYSS